jgi:hypothetical protein
MNHEPIATARFIIIARIALIMLGCIAVMWGSAVLPAFWRQSPLERISEHIIAGETYKSDALLGLIPNAELAEGAIHCRPAAVRSAAIIRTRFAEDALSSGQEDALSSGQQDPIDKQLNLLRTAIRNSLSCVPTDAFLWLVLFWVDSTAGGLEDQSLEYLRMSYRLGPNEGWIALKRNRMAFTIYERLPPDLAESAIVEFIGLLEMGLYQEAVDILTGPAWDLRELLLTRLTDAPFRHRLDFAKFLSDGGYDVQVPGLN